MTKRHKFQPGQEVWWLNTSFWRVQSVTIVEHAGVYGSRQGWLIQPTRHKSGQSLIEYENDLFLKQVDAYKEGMARLAEKTESHVLRLKETLATCENFVDKILFHC